MPDTNQSSKLSSLESLGTTDSGYIEIKRNSESERNYFRFLSQLVTGQHTELDNYLMENPHLLDTTKHKALFLMNLVALGQKILPFHISVSGPKPHIADEIAYHLIELYSLIKENLDLGIEDIDWYQYKAVMPSLVIYYSDYLLANNDKLEQVLQEISNNANFANLIDDNLIAQQHRLLALYYRRSGDQGKAEEELSKYRENFKPKAGSDYRLVKIHPSKAYPSAQVLEHLGEIYQEVSEIQQEVLDRSGVYRDTCFYYQCTDCCKKDFPTVSLTEYLYIEQWCKDNNKDMASYKAKAQAIQEKHTAEYGEPLKIVDQAANSAQLENPNDFQFTCPFLDDQDQCEIHPARPLACRSFGLSTIDNSSVQACNYYLRQYQANSSHRNERIVYDSRDTTALIGGSNSYLAGKHGYSGMRQPVGSLVAWLSA